MARSNGSKAVRELPSVSKERRTRRLIRTIAPGLAGLSLCGCAGFWDEVTNREFKFSSLFSKPHPMVVLRDSTDGDARAKALRALREPKQSGGSEQDQEAVMKILLAAATTERQPLCRLAAIESLGRFKDPRAVKGLTDAYYNATVYPVELATRIQCASLTALGETRDPQAVELLVKVVEEPPADGAETEKQHAMDVRIAAARALGNFRDPHAADALVKVLQKDKDVAIRDRANESLQASTGQDLPPDANAWNQYLHPAPGQPRVVQGEATQKVNWFGWFGN